MKTLEKIREEYAKKNGCETWEQYLEDTKCAFTQNDYNRVNNEIADVIAG